LNSGQEPQESAAKIGADVYVVGEFDKKGDVLSVSLESFSVTTNQFFGNPVINATNLDVPGKIDFTALFGKSAGAAPTPATTQAIDPIAMQSAATPQASLEASPEPTATPVSKPSSAPQPKAQPHTTPANRIRRANRSRTTSRNRNQPRS
jgi:hypothetical protein